MNAISTFRKSNLFFWLNTTCVTLTTFSKSISLSVFWWIDWFCCRVKCVLTFLTFCTKQPTNKNRYTDRWHCNFDLIVTSSVIIALALLVINVSKKKVFQNPTPIFDLRDSTKIKRHEYAFFRNKLVFTEMTRKGKKRRLNVI